MTGSDGAAQIREDMAPDVQALHQASSQEVLSGKREEDQKGEDAGGKSSMPGRVPTTEGSWISHGKGKGTEKTPSPVALSASTTFKVQRTRVKDS